MTRTPPTKDSFLSNNRLEVFKSNTKLVKASDGLFNCSLKLPDESYITIPMREDGYINVTMLCKASGKDIKEWKKNKSSVDLINASFSLGGIPPSQLLNSTRVGKTQNTFAHPDIAIQIAQWCSPSFAIQVSRWMRELLLFGKVELGQEKSNKELENKFQEQIKQLTQEKQEAIQEKQQAIKEKEEVILEKANITRRLSSVTQNHNKLLKRRRRGVYEIGNVVYILSHFAYPQSKDFYLYYINRKLK
jgi:hypothetical protein